MSRVVADAWVRTIIRQPQAQKDALRFLERVEREAKDGILLIGSQLSATERSYLARWDRSELIVIELTVQQQKCWNVVPLNMVTRLQSTSEPFRGAMDKTVVSMTNIRFDHNSNYDRSSPLTGTCEVEVTEQFSTELFKEDWALRAEFFRPDVSGYACSVYYTPTPILEHRVKLPFQFSPLYIAQIPMSKSWYGELIVFLQLFSSKNWSGKEARRKISNLTYGGLTAR